MSLFRIPTLDSSGQIDLWNDGPESWYADRADLEAQIRDCNSKASEEELEDMYAQIMEFEPSSDQLIRWESSL